MSITGDVYDVVTWSIDNHIVTAHRACQKSLMDQEILVQKNSFLSINTDHSSFKVRATLTAKIAAHCAQNFRSTRNVVCVRKAKMLI